VASEGAERKDSDYVHESEEQRGNSLVACDDRLEGKAAASVRLLP
jgi:hypothetical protein